MMCHVRKSNRCCEFRRVSSSSGVRVETTDSNLLSLSILAVALNPPQQPATCSFFVQARGLSIRLVTPSPADAEAARGVKYRSRHKGFRAGEKTKMAAISSESIFGSGKESSAQARRKGVLMKAAKLGIKTRGMRLMSAEGNATTSTRRSRHGSAPSSREETGKRKRQGFEENGDSSSAAIGNEWFQDGTPEAARGSSALSVGDKEGDDPVPKASRKRRKKKMIDSAAGGLAAIAGLY